MVPTRWSRWPWEDSQMVTRRRKKMPDGSYARWQDGSDGFGRWQSGKTPAPARR